MAGQCSRKCPDNSPTFMPSIPGLPLLDFTRFKACKQFSRSQTSSISCSSIAGLSVLRFAVDDSNPLLADFGASLLFSSLKASRSWLFCRLSLIESRRLLAASFRLGLRRLRRCRVGGGASGFPDADHRLPLSRVGSRRAHGRRRW